MQSGVGFCFALLIWIPLIIYLQTRRAIWQWGAIWAVPQAVRDFLKGGVKAVHVPPAVAIISIAEQHLLRRICTSVVSVIANAACECILLCSRQRPRRRVHQPLNCHGLLLTKLGAVGALTSVPAVLAEAHEELGDHLRWISRVCCVWVCVFVWCFVVMNSLTCDIRDPGDTVQLIWALHRSRIREGSDVLMPEICTPEK